MEIFAKLRKIMKNHRKFGKISIRIHIFARNDIITENISIMDILLTNDDGYRAKGIQVLAEIMKEFGNVTVIAPKQHQSGMSMAISMNRRPLAYRKTGQSEGISWAYLDATPASCVKFALNNIFTGKKPDVVVSGINHGSNAATAACYSGTLGAVAEAALNGIPGIGVSLDTNDADADFSSVEKYFPGIFRKLAGIRPAGYGIYYNINFPGSEAGEIKGTRVASQGMGKWIKEFLPWNAETLQRLGLPPETAGQAVEEAGPGEELYIMTGEFTDDERNPEDADHRLNKKGYITVVPHKIDCTDYAECERLIKAGIEVTF